MYISNTSEKIVIGYVGCCIYICLSFLHYIWNQSKYRKMIYELNQNLDGIRIVNDYNEYLTSFLNKNRTYQLLNYELIKENPLKRRMIRRRSEMNEILREFYVENYQTQIPNIVEYYYLYSPVFICHQHKLISSYHSELLQEIGWRKLLPGTYLSVYLLFGLLIFHSFYKVQCYFDVF